MLNILLCVLVSLVILVVALRFKKAALILLGILIVVGSVFGIMVWQSGKPKEPRNVQKSRPSHTLSARDLMSYYERDAYGADLNYGDKVIALTGDIAFIYREELDKYPNQFRHVIWLRAGRLSASSSKQGRDKVVENTLDQLDTSVSSSKQGRGKVPSGENPLDHLHPLDRLDTSSSKQGGGKVNPIDDFLNDYTPTSSSKQGGGKVSFDDLVDDEDDESSSKQGRGKVERVKCDFNRSEAYSLRNLKEGDTVKIKGRVSKSNSWDSTSGLRRDIYSDTRERFLYITLEDCVLVK